MALVWRSTYVLSSGFDEALHDGDGIGGRVAGAEDLSRRAVDGVIWVSGGDLVTQRETSPDTERNGEEGVRWKERKRPISAS